VESFIELADSVSMQINPVSIQIILPVGISFYTFQILSYTIDIYHRWLEPEPRLLNFALFVACFPQLVAGPMSTPAGSCRKSACLDVSPWSTWPMPPG